ncbi:MAG: lysophospholipid acyltransferase family protein [Microcystaceae cyanobacterium]
MFPDLPLGVSQFILSLFGTQMSVSYPERIPSSDCRVIVISNHRSFMDAPLLIQGLQRPIRIACHHYMGQTPFLRDMIQLLGCFPLAEPSQRSKQFLKQAQDFLRQRQWVGLFPEGTSPMIQLTAPNSLSQFERGFAHLAFQIDVPNLAILPVAIRSLGESVLYPFPLRTLRLFDPTEPLFDRSGFQPIVTYHRTHLLIGRPYYMTNEIKSQYKGKTAKKMVNHLTDYCSQEIASLLQ